MTCNPIFITTSQSISSLGSSKEEIRENILKAPSLSKRIDILGDSILAFPLGDDDSNRLNLTFSDRHYRHLDRVTKLSLLASSGILPHGLNENSRVGVCIGSARGTTETLESLHNTFLQSPSHTVPPYTSPSTTAGSIASTVAAELSLSGPAISTSMTCASFMHSLLTAWGLLHTNFFDGFIVGGAEAPLTPFTISQMQALRIYSTLTNDPFPCRPVESHQTKRNTMVLGEGAASFFIETLDSLEKRGLPPSGLPIILGIGFARETAVSSTGMDPDGRGIKESMELALKASALDKVDAILLHAPGTALGDAAELEAIHNLFGEDLPFLASTKYLTGHTFGASAALSLYMALLLLEGSTMPKFPYQTTFNQNSPTKEIKTCLINSAGFGGSIMSLVVGLHV